jgi:hypothetical protein
LFHDPSVSVASSVFPRFQPGLMASKNLPAEMGAKVDFEGHLTLVLLPVLFPTINRISRPSCRREMHYLLTLRESALKQRSRKYCCVHVAAHGCYAQLNQRPEVAQPFSQGIQR